MNIIYFLSLLACACAAPEFYHNFLGSRSLSDRYFDDNVFDTRSFWADLADEMHKMDDMLQEFTKHFPSSTSNEGVEGDNYVVVLTVSDFEEKDIVVKARQGLLMVQAIHKSEDGNQKSYVDLRTLPADINVAGSWTYDKGVLRIVFPMTKQSGSDVTETDTETETIVTEAPRAVYHSREEMDNKDEDRNMDADVGLENVNKDREILTNVIPSNGVEATTYAVDLKNEIDFVPIKY